MKALIAFFILSLLSLCANASGGGGATSPYLSLEPPLVVNVTDQTRVRHMQVGIQLKVPKLELQTHVDMHKAAIRHEMVMMLSGQNVAEITTITGKEKLRQDALAAVQKTLEELTGSAIVEGLYFTSFVIQ